MSSLSSFAATIAPFKIDDAMITGLGTSALLIAVLWTMRVVLVRAVSRRNDILSPDQRRWVQTIRSLVWVITILGLIMIWAPQLHTVALSLTAFVVAIVIATKEVIMCFMGAFMRVSTAPFRMGDWITIDGTTGEVVDINPFSAKVQELDLAHGTFNFTGKVIQIPNSRYFTFPIENLSYMKQVRPLALTIGIQEDKLDAAVLRGKLEKIVEKHTAGHHAEAAQIIKRIKRNSHIALPDPAPQILFAAHDFNNLNFTVRVYVPTHEGAAIGSAITQEFMSEVAKLRKAPTKRKKTA